MIEPAEAGERPESDLSRLYDTRFDDHERSAKDKVWREIVRYLGRWIDPTAPVMDLGCDRGHFIRWVTATERWASDIRDMTADLPADVHFICSPGLELDTAAPAGHFGTVFISNYLEHLPSTGDVIEQLHVVRRLLRPGGRVIILQPNIRLVGARYWDFIDHKVPLTEHSLTEAVELADLATERVITRFLPYSTKGRLPSHPALVRAYFAFPPAWWVLGRQTLLVGRRVT